MDPPALDLDDARAALAPIAGRPAPPDRLALAWHADLARALWPDRLDPLDAVLPFGALAPDARRLLALLVETAREVPSMRAAAAASPLGPAAFTAPAAALAERLPSDAVRAEALRQEELLRRWAALAGAPLAVGGASEPAARSAQVLARLDYARVRAEEQRLADERTIAEARRSALHKVATGAPL